MNNHDCNIVYRRTSSNWLSGHPFDRSLTYWRSFTRTLFAKNPKIEEVEIVRSGNKTDSNFLTRGDKFPAENQCVIISSTGGKWGKCRREFFPRGV